MNPDGTVNAYVEIPLGERRKFEFDIKANARVVDRVMPETMGGYPVNYGFVPQTMSWDGDPFDVLVLGPAIAGGTVNPGVIVGIMFMEDEKGLDSKVVVSPTRPGGQPRYPLTDADRKRIGDYFARYKQHEPGKFSRVPGWGSIAEGRAHVDDDARVLSRVPEREGEVRAEMTPGVVLTKLNERLPESSCYRKTIAPPTVQKLPTTFSMTV